MNFEKLREDFEILNRRINGKQIIYFDNAATSQKPRQVIEAMNDYYLNYCANIHRGVYKLSTKASEEYEMAHNKVANFINAKKDQIIFTKNTTESLNLIYYAWGLHNLKEGDEVITSVMEHHSNIVPFLQLKKWKGINIKYVDINDDGTLKINQYEDLITNKTKLIAVTQTSNAIGTINPIREISKIANDAKVLFIVDGAQSVPHMPVNFKKLDIDFLAFSAHKMLGPTGVGALVGKRETLENMEPFLLGGDMINEVHLNSYTLNDLPWKFEAGTSPIAEGIGFGAAVDYLSKLKMENVRKHEKELTEYALEKMKGIKNLELYGPFNPETRAGIITFNIKGIPHHEVALILDELSNVECRSGVLCAQPTIERLNLQGVVRASFYIYNTKEEIDIFIDSLKKIAEQLT